MKVARTVIAGGKAGDNIKRLPIGKVAYPVAPATGVAPTHIKTFDGETIDLYGKQTVSVKFPEDCFDAFSVCLPDGSIKRFSAQKIYQDM